ncbi:MAG: NADH:ubiquinone oxidoreductase subunit NDUFA12 [Rhodospirillaceae bacterium]|nr:NADH:ubiquinone oxidoreductase subunit NDUFA12 [Rhodospirillaceae bacterium]
MKFKDLFKFIFDWWHKATFSTWLYTLLHGEFVAEDEYGNRYFQKKLRKIKESPHWVRHSRWVIYNGVAEASAVPPDWNAWLQHNTESPPIKNSKNFSWEKSHLPNLTGTTAAYSPKNSVSETKNKSKLDYEPWLPE